MANKRKLKKSIKVICDELFVECVAASLYGNNVNDEDANALLLSIIQMQEDYTSRICHPEPGMSATAYFRDLREKFTAHVSEIVDQISNM